MNKLVSTIENNAPESGPGENDAARVGDALVSRRILLLSNVLRRAAGLRYRRLLGLPKTEWGIVAELGMRPPCTLNALAAAVGLDKAQMSRSVSALAARGLVLRRPNLADNREIFLRLSAKGRDVYTRLIEASFQANEQLLSGVTRDDRERLNTLLDVIADRAQQHLRAEQQREAPNRGATD